MGSHLSDQETTSLSLLSRVARKSGHLSRDQLSHMMPLLIRSFVSSCLADQEIPASRLACRSLSLSRCESRDSRVCVCERRFRKEMHADRLLLKIK